MIQYLTDPAKLQMLNAKGTGTGTATGTGTGGPGIPQLPGMFSGKTNK